MISKLLRNFNIKQKRQEKGFISMYDLNFTVDQTFTCIFRKNFASLRLHNFYLKWVFSKTTSAQNTYIIIVKVWLHKISSTHSSKVLELLEYTSLWKLIKGQILYQSEPRVYIINLGWISITGTLIFHIFGTFDTLDTLTIL